MSTARDSLIGAAADLMVRGMWAGTPLADVAGRAGVSRQTLYNEFGNRDGLANAVAVQVARRFRTGTVAAAAEHDDPVAAIGGAMAWALATAHGDRLIQAALVDDSVQLLPYLTTRSTLVLTPIAADLAELIDRPTAGWACEVALRLTVSHLLSPTTSDEVFVASVMDLLRPLFADNP